MVNVTGSKSPDSASYNGAHKAIRTPDLFLTKEVLYLLSYMSLKSSSPCFLPNVLERVAGIEPASSAWKAEVIASIRHPQILFFLAQNDLLYIRCRFWGWIIGPALDKSLYRLGVDCETLPAFHPFGAALCASKFAPGKFVEPGASAWF